MSSRSRRARTAFLQRKLFLIIFLETNGARRQMGFKSAKGGGKGSKAARRNVGGDKSDAHKRKAEEAFMSPLEVMRQKYLRKKAGNTARQKDVRPWRSHRLRLFCAARL